MMVSCVLCLIIRPVFRKLRFLMIDYSSMTRRFAGLLCFVLLAHICSFLLCNWLLWTPLERYYLGAYLDCEWHRQAPVETAQIRWLYKTEPHRKKVLASDSDVVLVSLDSGHGARLQLSLAARHAGWTGLLQGPEERFKVARLGPFLRANFYDGESLWMVLTIPLLIGTAMLFFLLAGRNILKIQIEHRRWRAQRFEWQDPPLSLFKKWRMKTAGIRFRLPRLPARESLEIVSTPRPQAPSACAPEPGKKPTQLPLPFFATPDEEPKDSFVWDETKGID